MIRPGTVLSRRDLALGGILAAWLGLGLAACGRAGAPATRERAELADERRVYADLVEPLDAGQRALIQALAASDAKPAAFCLGADGAEPLDETASATLVDAGAAVFYRLSASEAGGEPALAYVDPAALEVVEVTSPDAISAGIVRTGDQDRAFSLVRACAWKTLTRDDQLEIVRFDFRVGDDGTPIVVGCARLTDDPAHDSSPVPMPDGRVAFLRRDGDRAARLMTVPLSGGEPAAVFAEQPFDVRLPRWIDDRLLFAADIAGVWRLSEIEPATGARRDFVGPSARPRRALRAILAGRVADGRVVPQLIELPRVYDLDAVVGLVAARNPSINKRRALLAAALIEARQIDLARWPKLTWSLDYTAAQGVLLAVPGAGAGDVLAAGLGRGLLGLVQPLFELPRTNALTEGGRVRAEIARDVLADELNTRLSEAAEWYFRAAGHHAALAVRAEQVGNASERVRWLMTMAGEREISRAEILDAHEEIALARVDEKIERGKLAYACDRLRELADLPPDVPLALADDPFRFDLAGDASFPELRRTALLNHPRLRAARRALVAAFYEKKAEGQRPTANVSVAYGHVRKRFVDPVDDYITMSLNGELPLRSWKSEELKEERWRALADALELDAQEQAHAVSAQLDEALAAHDEARGYLEVRRAELASRLEALRVARLHLAIGMPNDRADVDRGDLIKAHTGWYRTLAATLASRADLAVSRARLYRELGIAATLRDDLQPIKASRVAQGSIARWLWQARATIDDDARIDAWLAACVGDKVKRVYAYLEADARLLDDAQAAERLALFIDRCAAQDIEVWALLGEPEWLDDGGDAAIALGSRRIAGFNQRFAAFAPRLAGLKLDIEPHAREEWRSDAAARDALATRWIGLIAAARRELPALTIWADCPPQYFRPEMGDLVERLSGIVDGVTLMAYGDREAWIAERTDEALARWPKALEIGLELGAAAPAGETLAGWRAEEIAALRARLIERHRDDGRFAGLALHEAVPPAETP
ncbi:MAG TPA: TolC family protein [Planctomycetota bacterium]|nr:TolC family protein [Planctomycetota bacterium]